MRTYPPPPPPCLALICKAPIPHAINFVPCGRPCLPKSHFCHAHSTMNHISFAFTKPQILDQSKDVTRRMGWLNAKVGQHLQPVEKGMGLKKGEKVVKLGEPILLVKVSREPLRRLLDDPEYGKSEVIREGFPNLTPSDFVTFYCRTHKGCTPDTELTRLQYSYTAPVPKP